MPESISAADRAFKASLDAFVGNELGLRDNETRDARRLRIIDASKALGLFTKTQPKEFGGDPGTTVQLTIARETLAAARASDANAAFGSAPGVLAGAQGALKTNYLEPLMALSLIHI